MRDNSPCAQSAEQYDGYTASQTAPWDEILIARVCQVRPAHVTQGTLLDVGTGTAVLLDKLAGVDDFAGWRLVGIDYYADMVEKANQRLQARGLQDRIEVRVGDAHALPFADNSVDMVMSRATLHHLLDPAGSFREVYRVLAPGGVGVIHDLRRDAPADVLAEFNRLRAEVGIQPTKIEEKYTVREVEQFLAAAGLTDVSDVLAADSGRLALGFEVKIVK